MAERAERLRVAAEERAAQAERERMSADALHIRQRSESARFLEDVQGASPGLYSRDWKMLRAGNPYGSLGEPKAEMLGNAEYTAPPELMAALAARAGMRRTGGRRFLGSWGSEDWRHQDENGNWVTTHYSGFRESMGNAFDPGQNGIAGMAGSMVGSQLFGGMLLNPLNQITTALTAPLSNLANEATKGLIESAKRLLGAGDKLDAAARAQMIAEETAKMQTTYGYAGSRASFLGLGNEEVARASLMSALSPAVAAYQTNGTGSRNVLGIYQALTQGNDLGAIEQLRQMAQFGGFTQSDINSGFAAELLQAAMSLKDALGLNTDAILAMSRQLADDLYIASLRAAASGEFAGARSEEERIRIRNRIEQEASDYLSAIRGGSPVTSGGSSAATGSAGATGTGGYVSGGQSSQDQYAGYAALGSEGNPISLNLAVTVNTPSGEQLTEQVVKVYKDGSLQVRTASGELVVISAQ